ncbi:MAG TPA: hypothetical protein VIL01_12360 [Thermomicrobiales bacterium]
MIEPASDEATFEHEIHQRLLEGDPLAASDLCVHFLGRLVRQLQRNNPETDPDLVNDAVTEALLNYARRPQQYDPAKRSLSGYLFMSAQGDLRNLLEKHRRTSQHIPFDEHVENSTPARNSLAEHGDLADVVAGKESERSLRERLLAMAQDEEERIVLELMMDGVRETDVYIQALGRQGQPEVLRKRLYTIKDRLTKRIRRAREGCHG